MAEGEAQAATGASVGVRGSARTWLAMLLALAGTACAPSMHPAAACSAAWQPRPWNDFSRLVAHSETIVLATPTLDAAALTAGEETYLPVKLLAPEMIKAHSRALPDSFQYFAAPTTRPSPEDVARLAGNKAIVFLVTGDGEENLLYLAGGSAEALQPATNASLAKLRTEVERQRRLLASWRASPGSPHFGRLKKLIDELAGLRAASGEAGEDRQARIFSEIEELGPSAVPALIALMDDLRPLAFDQISLVNNFPGAFEGIRHYGPERVVDALAAILNQITSESFGNIHNGGTEEQRSHAVAGWRTYAADQERVARQACAKEP